VLFKYQLEIDSDEGGFPTNRLAVYEPGDTKAGVSSAVRLQWSRGSDDISSDMTALL